MPSSLIPGGRRPPWAQNAGAMLALRGQQNRQTATPAPPPGDARARCRTPANRAATQPSRVRGLLRTTTQHRHNARAASAATPAPATCTGALWTACLRARAPLGPPVRTLLRASQAPRSCLLGVGRGVVPHTSSCLVAHSGCPARVQTKSCKLELHMVASQELAVHQARALCAGHEACRRQVRCALRPPRIRQRKCHPVIACRASHTVSHARVCAQNGST